MCRVEQQAVGRGATCLRGLGGPGLAETRHGLPALERQFTTG
jgi:hypothetical protein